MRKLFLIISMVCFWSGYCIASDYLGTIKNQKGQTVGKLRDAQNKVEVLDKKGSVQGWIDKKSGKTYDNRGFSTGSININKK